MFASLVLATRGRPLLVWLGAAAASAVHVAIAVTIGVALFSLVPHRVVDVIVAVAFAVGAIDITRGSPPVPRKKKQSSRFRPADGVAVSAFVVIFVAEWGDLTQILTANLADSQARTLLRFVSVRRVRQAIAVILLLLAAYASCMTAR